MTAALSPARAIASVISAARHMAAHEYSAPGDPYDRLYDLANGTTTAGRIEIAAAAYLHGSASLRGSRIMDNCFENGDSDEVAAALARRADIDPQLFAAIASDFSGTFPASWRAPSLFDHLPPTGGP